MSRGGVSPPGGVSLLGGVSSPGVMEGKSDGGKE